MGTSFAPLFCGVYLVISLRDPSDDTFSSQFCQGSNKYGKSPEWMTRGNIDSCHSQLGSWSPPRQNAHAGATIVLGRTCRSSKRGLTVSPRRAESLLVLRSEVRMAFRIKLPSLPKSSTRSVPTVLHSYRLWGSVSDVLPAVDPLRPPVPPPLAPLGAVLALVGCHPPVPLR